MNLNKNKRIAETETEDENSTTLMHALTRPSSYTHNTKYFPIEESNRLKLGNVSKRLAKLSIKKEELLRQQNTTIRVARQTAPVLFKTFNL